MNGYGLTLNGSFVQNGDEYSCGINMNSSDGLDFSIEESGENAYIVLDKVIDKLIAQCTEVVEKNRQKEPTIEEKYEALQRQYNDLVTRMNNIEQKKAEKPVTKVVIAEKAKPNQQDGQQRAAKNNRKAVFNKSCDSKVTEIDAILNELNKMLHK